MIISVPFRDTEVDIQIDRYIEEPDVNYFEVQWHFCDRELNQETLTDEEEQYIQEKCWEHRYA